MTLRPLCLALTLAAAGCSGPGAVTTPPAYDPTGRWSGVWQSEDGTASGTLSLEFYLRTNPGEPGGAQSIHFRASGAACGPSGDVGEGSYGAEVAKVNFFVMIQDADSASLDASGASFAASVDGNRLVGSYATAAFGNCAYCGCPFGLRGSWSATRSR